MTTPRTELELLLSRSVGSRLRLDVDGIAPHLPLLDEVVAMTANGAALLSVLGRYAAPTFAGQALTVSGDEVNLRLDREAAWAFVSTRPDDDAREPAGLWMFDGSGTAVHRGYLVSPDAGMVVDLMHLAERPPRRRSLSALLPSDPGPHDPGAPDQLGLLDGLLVDGGRGLAAAPGTPIEVRRLGEILAGCCEIGLPVGAAVPNLGAVQVHTGVLDHVEMQGRVLSAVSGPAQFAVGLDDAVGARLVPAHGAHGPTTAVLVFDDAGRCVAMLTQFGVLPADRHRAWERMVTDPLG